MAVVKPFQAMRLAGDRVSLGKVLAPDPQGLGREGLQALVERDPRNVARLCTPIAEAGDGARAFERRAALLFAELVRARLLVKDERPAFYCLRKKGDEDAQGFFAAVETDAAQVA